MKYIKPHPLDPEMAEILEEIRGKTVLWGTVHIDFLDSAELGIIEIEVLTE